MGCSPHALLCMHACTPESPTTHTNISSLSALHFLYPHHSRAQAQSLVVLPVRTLFQGSCCARVLVLSEPLNISPALNAVQHRDPAVTCGRSIVHLPPRLTPRGQNRRVKGVGVVADAAHRPRPGYAMYATLRAGPALHGGRSGGATPCRLWTCERSAWCVPSAVS